MNVRVVVLTLSSLAFAGPEARAEDVGGALGRLASPRASERSGAQRWLAAHLGSDDLAVVSNAAQAGDAEVRARLVEALGGEDRLLGLAADLATSGKAEPASVGRAALIESAERWSTGSKKPGLVQSAAFAALREDHDRTLVVDALLAAGPLDVLFDALARSGVDDLAIAVDPRCNQSAGTVHATDGRLDSVLSDVLAARGLACRGFGLGDEEPAGAKRWIAIVPRDSEARSNTAANLLSGWCLDVASVKGASAGSAGPADAPMRAQAARALSASGWPAAIAWLGDRWFAQDDAAALEGVLLAARRGRVAPVLLRPAAQSRLRTVLERALTTPHDAGSNSGVDALANVGDATAVATALGMTGTLGPHGEDLVAPALEGLVRLDGRALYARLVELEQRAAVGHDSVQALTELLTRAEVAPASQWLALGMLTRAASPPQRIGRPELFLAWCEDTRHLAELSRMVRGLDLFPPDGWKRPDDLPRAFSPRVRATIASAWLARGDLDAAVDHVVAAIGDEPAREELAAGLGASAKDIGIGPLTQLFDRALARAPADPDALLRAAALSGAAVSEDFAKRALALVAEPAVTRGDLLVLGALAAGPRGDDARPRLIAALRGGIVADDAVAAVDRAVTELRAARDETVERAFVREARAAARAGSKEVRARLRLDAWPAPPPGEPVHLSDYDRSFERAGMR